MKLVPQVLPRIDSNADARVTCIVNVEDFYVYLPEKVAVFGVTLESLKRNMNEAAMVEEYRNITEMPGIEHRYYPSN